MVFERGLDDRELHAIEDKYGFHFPPDLRRFLGHGLPISKSWVNWRSDTERAIRDRMAWPYEGLCFDVEENAFWLDRWGPKPTDLGEAFAVVARALKTAPKLIPIFSHRYIPDRPQLEGNPIFSVYQGDIITYGGDLETYLGNEFGYYFGEDRYRLREPARTIELWSELVELNDGPPE
ncbi:MAG TPA: SMI1/KNR4 family protein [Polyangia bacterium]